MFSGHDLRNAPPVFFSPCRKEDGPRREASPLGRPGQKKRAPNAMNSCTARKPGIAIVERGAALVQSLYLLTQPSAKARLRSRRCLVEKRTTLTPLPGESNGGIRRSPLAVSIREGQGSRKRAGGTFAAKAGSKLCLRPGPENTESSPPLWRFFCNFSLANQRKVDMLLLPSPS